MSLKEGSTGRRCGMCGFEGINKEEISVGKSCQPVDSVFNEISYIIFLENC